MPASKKQAAAIQDKAAEAALNDDSVREYLQENGDFLQRNPDMLDHLHISHASGSAISLVEKQVSVLRERNIDMRHRLKTLTRNARENDQLYDHTRDLVLRLIEADSPAALNDAFIDSMHKDFNVEQACMILFGDGAALDGCRVDTLEQAKAEIGGLLKGGKAVCGTLRQQELNYLFPPEAGGPGSSDVGSAALMPLSNGELTGLIAVGSADANRYSTAMGTLFLSHLADVIVRLLPRLQHEGT